jgi:light-independent protochlorophyllide reductase subunit B
MGWEGATVIFDSWVHPLVMGLEEHLLTMFREDFEFHDGAGPSHLGAGSHGPGGPPGPLAAAVGPASPAPARAAPAPVSSAVAAWLPAAEDELRKIPFFVRAKARRNTERFAAERGLAAIGVDTLYEAKAHYAR